MTAYPADFASRLSKSLTHTLRVEVQPHSPYSEPFELQVEDIAVTFDESFSPHVQANLTCVIPDDEVQLSALDPRNIVAVRIYTGYVLPDGPVEELLADLLLRSVTLRHSQQQVSLFLSGDEALLQDFTLIGSEVLPDRRLNQVVRDIVGWVGFSQTRTMRSAFEENDFHELLTQRDDYGYYALRGTPGQSAWDALQDIADRCGVWIYCSNGVDWNVQKRPEIAQTPFYSLSVGENGTVISSEVQLSREKFFNAVYLDYFTNKIGVGGVDDKYAGGVQPGTQTFGNAFITAGTLAPTVVGLKTYYEKRDDAASKEQANATAQSLLFRLLTKGYQYSVEAVAHYGLRPGQTVEVQLANGGPRKLLVKAVTFTPRNGLMAVQLRQPELSTIQSI